MAAKPLRVFLVEDDERVLRQQARLLRGVRGVEVAGTARDGGAALRAIAEAKPDVVLVDLGLPGVGGVELIRRLKPALPAVEFLVFTVFDSEDKVLEAIRAGAAGYLLKGTPADRLVEAVREVAAGGSVVQPQLARSVLQRFAALDEARRRTPAPPPGRAAEEPVPSLSPREREILGLIAKGLSNAEVGQVLGLARATVRTHLEHIYAKLDVANRTEAVTEGIRKGIIEV